MNPSFYRMQYANKAFLTLEDVRRITLASVFVADEVLLPATVYVSPELTEVERDFILTRLQGLHELKAVRFWKIEGVPEIKTQARPSDKVSIPPDQIITPEQYNAIMEMIDDRLMEQRQLFLREAATSYDGITEMVLGRQTMWKFAIASNLDVDRLLISEQIQSTMQQFFSDLMRYEEFESLIIDRIADKLNLPDVSQLSLEDIESCRKFMPLFREKLLQTSENQYDELFLMTMVEKIADSIVNEFFDLIQKHNLKAAKIFGKPMLRPNRLMEDFTWDLLQLLFAPIIAVKFAKLFFEWYKDSSATAPLLLLMRLRELK